MIRLTSRPATLPASLVAWRWSSLKYAGTVITALSTVSPRYASASAFSFWRIIALISGGAYSLPPAFTRASPFGPGVTSKGTIFSSSLTSASLRPMKRLIEKIVLSGFVTARRLAGAPTRRSPPSVNATTEGVVRAPSAFSITVGSPPSRTAMHELVVPRSIPMVLAIVLSTSNCRTKSKPEYGRCKERRSGQRPHTVEGRPVSGHRLAQDRAATPRAVPPQVADPITRRRGETQPAQVHAQGRPRGASVQEEHRASAAAERLEPHLEAITGPHAAPLRPLGVLIDGEHLAVQQRAAGGGRHPARIVAGEQRGGHHG